MKIDPNGPMWPCFIPDGTTTEVVDVDSRTIEEHPGGHHHPGASIRVWLAGQALPAVITAAEQYADASKGTGSGTFRPEARVALEIADALIAELNK